MRIGRFLLTAVITASAFTAMAAPQADKDKMEKSKWHKWVSDSIFYK